MGAICQHEPDPVDTLVTVSNALPTLLAEEGNVRKPPANRKTVRGSMEHDDASIASEGKAALRREGSRTLAPGMGNDDEGDGTERSQDELPQTELPLLSETCQESLPLVVVVLCAKGLREADWLPGTHRYFYTFLRTCPQRQGKLTCRTRAVKDVVDPMNDVVDANWSEEDGIMEAQYVAGDSLEFDVVDTDGDGTSGLIGRAFLDAARFSECGFIGELPLEGAGTIFGAAATLSVEIMQPGQTRQFSPKKAAVVRDPIDPIDPRDPRSSLFALIKDGTPSRRHLVAEAFARKRIW